MHICILICVKSLSCRRTFDQEDSRAAAVMRLSCTRLSCTRWHASLSCLLLAVVATRYAVWSGGHAGPWSDGHLGSSLWAVEEEVFPGTGACGDAAGVEARLADWAARVAASGRPAVLRGGASCVAAVGAWRAPGALAARAGPLRSVLENAAGPVFTYWDGDRPWAADLGMQRRDGTRRLPGPTPAAAILDGDGAHGPWRCVPAQSRSLLLCCAGPLQTIQFSPHSCLHAFD